MKLVRAWAYTGVTSYRHPRLESCASTSPDGCGAVAIRSPRRGWEVYRIDSTGLEMFVGFTGPVGTDLLDNTLAALRDMRSEAA